MPIKSRFDNLSIRAANRRERCRAHRSSGARSAHRRSDIVAVAINLDQAGASHHATSFTSSASPFTPKKPIQWRSDLGDRHRLFQLRSTASIIDSILSGERQSNSMHAWPL